MKQLIHNDWWGVLEPQFESAYYAQLHAFLADEYAHQTIYPEMHHIFEAFEWTPFSKVKVVILGQDPYHGPHQAHGCSFSVLPGVKIPPSLQNIYKELQDDLGYPPVEHGYLKKWADQGVLLLNSVLTVRAGQAFSHRGHGWEQLTDAAIHALSERGVYSLGQGSPIKNSFDQHADQHCSAITAPQSFFCQPWLLWLKAFF